MLNDLLASGYRFDEDEFDLKTKYFLINGMILLVVFSLLVLGAFRIATGDGLQGAIDYTAAATGIFFLLVQRHAGKGAYRPVFYIVSLTAVGFILLS